MSEYIEKRHLCVVHTFIHIISRLSHLSKSCLCLDITVDHMLGTAAD